MWHDCYISVDGTDVPIQEPSPFSSRWYSYKLNGPGLRYEVGISLGGDIVWLNGPFRPGDFNDVQIFRQDLKHELQLSEKVFADDGYPDRTCVRKCNLPIHFIPQFERIMSRHETVNSHFKRFNVLTTPFRHGLQKHKMFFEAVANVCQALHWYEEPLFSFQL